jgi:hypothetical protein
MTPVEFAARHTIPAALALLPPAMTSPQAIAQLLAIGLQESRFTSRRQFGDGPARGFWQFERAGGVLGVLTHPASGRHVPAVMKALSYPPDPASSGGVHALLEHNDVLAAAFARLLLWTSPKPLPTEPNAEAGWQAYIDTWRPGKPHRATWDAFYAQAWDLTNKAMPVVAPHVFDRAARDSGQL